MNRREFLGKSLVAIGGLGSFSPNILGYPHDDQIKSFLFLPIQISERSESRIADAPNFYFRDKTIRTVLQKRCYNKGISIKRIYPTAQLPMIHQCSRLFSFSQFSTPEEAWNFFDSLTSLTSLLLIANFVGPHIHGSTIVPCVWQIDPEHSVVRKHMEEFCIKNNFNHSLALSIFVNRGNSVQTEDFCTYDPPEKLFSGTSYWIGTKKDFLSLIREGQNKDFPGFDPTPFCSYSLFV
jgi:hypothetical protein